MNTFKCNVNDVAVGRCGISPAHPPLRLVSGLKSDCDERYVLPKVEHSLTLRAQHLASSCHFIKCGTPIDNNFKRYTSLGKNCFGGHTAKLSPRFHRQGLSLVPD